jgi:hypothetical protein
VTVATPFPFPALPSVIVARGDGGFDERKAAEFLAAPETEA